MNVAVERAQGGDHLAHVAPFPHLSRFTRHGPWPLSSKREVQGQAFPPRHDQ